MEIIPESMSPQELREEVNYRTARAGYTTRSGEPIMPKIRSMPLTEQGRRNYERIFGHK